MVADRRPAAAKARRYTMTYDSDDCLCERERRASKICRRRIDDFADGRSSQGWLVLRESPKDLDETNAEQGAVKRGQTKDGTKAALAASKGAERV